ncbi:MAG: hypothetical protein ACI9KE_000250 [Polyangiales bacterium]|jgi:hypothetical protein
MPRRPRITLPPSVLVPTRPTAPRVRPAPAPRLRVTALARANKTIKAIRKRLRSADAEYYAVGKALAGLDRPEVLAAFDAANFDAFLDAHVMPHATAQRYMTVTKSYSEVVALRLGVEKAFHLVQYASLWDTRLSAAQLAQRDAAIGSPGRKLSTLSAADIATLVRMKKLGTARAALPKATRADTRAAQVAARQVEEVLGVDARVRVDKKRDLVKLEIRLSELLA